MKQLVTIRMNYRLQCLSADTDGVMVVDRAYSKIRPMYSVWYSVSWKCGVKLQTERMKLRYNCK